MDIEDVRERNRARHARFSKRHPHYQSDRQKLKRWRHPRLQSYVTAAGHRTYELADPRDANRLPRLIGYCKVTTQPVWSALWAAKDISNSRWAAWFRELAALGLTPVERLGWAFGIVMPINRFLAYQLVRDRIRRINLLTTGDPRRAPPWLLRNLRIARRGRPYPVGRRLPDGRIQRFESMNAAIQVIGGRPPEILAYWIHTASAGFDGSVWFDD